MGVVRSSASNSRGVDQPAQITPFVGREIELASLAGLLADPEARLITILGPGGIGKTRLALTSACSQASAFTHGVKFVPLTPLTEAGDIISAIAKALSIQFFEGISTRNQLLDFLSEKQLLLVLDNFEHLLDGAELVNEILLAAPSVKVLATSREKLNLLGEIRFRLAGMSFPQLPGQETGVRPSDGSDYGAVALFAQSAQRARPDYSLNKEELAHVIRICQLVEGNPLGILLAASWVEFFATQEIAAEIGRNLDFLEAEMHDLPKRHRSMRAVFDSSWRQLADAEQRVFARLAVFRGEFDLMAAETVAGATLQSVVNLVSKSLLQRYPDRSRYEIHELLRQYANEQLESIGQMSTARDQHSLYFADFMGQRLGDILGQRQLEARDEISADFENVRTAWKWAVGRRDFASVERMAKTTYVFCDVQSRNHDGEELFRQAREQLAPQKGEEPHPTWSRILLPWYDMHSDSIGPVSDLEKVTDQTKLSLLAAEKSNDRVTAGYCLLLQGILAAERGEYRRAINLHQQSIQYCPALEDGYFPFARMGHCYIALGQLEEALICFQRLLARAREIGECTAMAWALAQIGEVEFMKGHHTSSVRRWREATDAFSQFGATMGLVRSTSLLSLAAFVEGDSEQAKELAENAQSVAQEHSLLPEHYREALTVVGWLDMLEGQYGRAWENLEELMVNNPTRAEAILGLAYAAIGLQMPQEARRCLKALLNPEVTFRSPAFVLLQLPAAGMILSQKGLVEEAAELLTLALAHPSTPAKLAQRFPLLEDFRTSLKERLGEDYFSVTRAPREVPDPPRITSRLRELFQVSESVTRERPGLEAPSCRSEPPLVEPLSEREKDVLRLLKTDLTGPEIAQELFVSINTIRFHTKNIYSKLQVNNRIAAVHRAEELGL